MAFNSLSYIAFLLAVFALYWALVRYAKLALGLLLLASLVFYASWRREYVLLMVGTAAVDYFASALISRTESPRIRKSLLIVSLVYDLGILCIFKYFDFLISQVDALATWFGARDALTFGGTYLGEVDLGLLLPVGISFFTFQSMSYTIDVYRGQLQPIQGFWRYLLYVSFFPQLVAGPIVRARDFLPQLFSRPRLTNEMGGQAICLIALGLFKKVAIADPLALNLVDRVFSMPTGYSSFEVLMGVYGYALQIYCDFSGYSDIAIGSALLLGFKFPENFRAPYLARNLQDFWRRWHISLSSWLRDYLYISLGGNRHGSWKTYRNLCLTMLLGGLWHGAGWNFVIWGGLHGVGQAITRAISKGRNGAALFTGKSVAMQRALHVVAVLCTFHFVCFTWIFFRSNDLSEVGAVLSTIVDGSFRTDNLPISLVFTLLAGATLQFVPRSLGQKIMNGFGRLPSLAQAAFVVAFGLALQQLAQSGEVPFIYFQF